MDYGRQPPRFVLARTAEGSVWRVRHDVPDEVLPALRSLVESEPELLGPDDPPSHAHSYTRILGSVDRIGGGPFYAFPSDQQPDPDVVAITPDRVHLVPEELGGPAGLDDGLEQPCFAIVADGRAVSLCRTARLVPGTAQAGVKTLETYRGRGLAARVVGTWARAVRELGLEPLYSTWLANSASRAVARKLGLRLVGVDFNVY